MVGGAASDDSDTNPRTRARYFFMRCLPRLEASQRTLMTASLRRAGDERRRRTVVLGVDRRPGLRCLLERRTESLALSLQARCFNCCLGGPRAGAARVGRAAFGNSIYVTRAHI